MIEIRDMPASPSRALQVRTADRLRASLAREALTGLPFASGLSDADQRELDEVGGGRLAAIVFRVESLVGAGQSARTAGEVQSMVMREAARVIGQQVRRTDLLCSLREDALLLLAPALDRMNADRLAGRLRGLLPDGRLDIGAVQVQLRVKVGVATRGGGSWTIATLAGEAERNAAADGPSIAGVA
jgi:GGDEF domain-containing protein